MTGGFSGIGAGLLRSLEPDFQPEYIANIDIQTGCDVRNYEDVFKRMEAVIVPGELNYLVSNAGVVFLRNSNGGSPDFASMPLETLHDMVHINLLGQINVLHAFINLLRQKNATGNVVAMSSISAFYSGGLNMAVYDATKAAIVALAKDLVGEKTLRCINVLQPGSIRTNIGGWFSDFTVDSEGLSAVKRGQDEDSERLRSEVTIDHICSMVRYLFFTDHGMNGSVITIDAGLTLCGREGY